MPKVPLYSEGNLTMTNCLIYDNQCDAGEDVNYTGIVMIDDGSATITNCTFTENVEGNPLYLWSASSRPIIKNCLFYNNVGSNDIREHNVGSSYHPQMNNCYYEGRTGDFNTASETGNLTSGSVNFTNAGSDDFTLGVGSVCIDAGTPSGAPAKRFSWK